MVGIALRHFLGCRTDRRIQAGVGSEQNPVIFPISWVRADGKQTKKRFTWHRMDRLPTFLEKYFYEEKAARNLVLSQPFHPNLSSEENDIVSLHGLGRAADCPDTTGGSVTVWLLDTFRLTGKPLRKATWTLCPVAPTVSLNETMRVSFTTVQMFTPVVRSQTWIELPGGVVPYSRIPCWLPSAGCEASRQAGCAFDQTRGNLAFGVYFCWKSTSVNLHRNLATPKNFFVKGVSFSDQSIMVGPISIRKNSHSVVMTCRQMVWLACKLPKKRITDLSWIRVCWAMHLRKPEKTKCCMEGLDASWFDLGRHWMWEV